MSKPEIFQKGLKLTISSPDTHLREWAITYQWLGFGNEPELLKEPERLLLAGDSPSYKHVAIHQPRPGDDVTDLAINFQSNKARGVVLVSSSNELPDPHLKPSDSDDVKIPVVVISRSQGETLLEEVQNFSNTVHVLITRETSADSRVVDYQAPPRVLAASTQLQHSVEERTGTDPAMRTDYTGSNPLNLTTGIKELLFDTVTKQPLVMSKDSKRFVESFTLLDDYGQWAIQRRIRDSNVNETLQKVCGYLTTCMENTFAEDFPYHCTMAFRLQRLVPGRRVVSAVVNYHQSCVKRLRTLTRHSVQDVFLPFLTTRLMLPILGKQKEARFFLLCFCKEIATTYPEKGVGLPTNSVENFGIAVIAGAMSLAIQQYLPETRPNSQFWETFILKMNPDQLSWSEELLLELKHRLELASCMELAPKLTFDNNSLDRFIRQYNLTSIRKLWRTICLLWPVLPDKQATWNFTAGLARSYLEDRVRNPHLLLSSVCDDGTVEGLCEEAQMLILAIKDLQELGDIEDGNAMKEVEIRKWIKFVLTSRFLGVEHDKWPECVGILKRQVEAPFAKLVHAEVIEIVNRSVRQLKPTTLHNLVHKLCFIPEEVVCEFLRSHRRRRNEKLKDTVWCKLFRDILEREWNSLKTDVVNFLKRFANPHDSSPKDRMYFFTDLLELARPQRCPNLLTSEDGDLLDDLKVFLLEYLKPSTGLMQERVEDILNSDAGQTPLKEALLHVFFQVIVPAQDDLLDWQRPTCVDTFLMKISTEVESGKESRQSAQSDRSTTYQRLLVACCRRIPHSKFTLSNPPNVTQLAGILVALQCVNAGAPQGESLVITHTESEVFLTEEMKEYRQWFEDVRVWLSDVRHRFRGDRITISELQHYEHNYSKIKELYESFVCPDWLLAREEVMLAIEELKGAAENLTSCLLFPLTGGKRWGKVKDLLVSRNVAIDEDLFQSVDRHVSLKEHSREIQAPGQGVVCLSFKPTVTRAEAKKIHDEVSKYLEPIMNNKNLLCYFFSNNSVLFEAFLENELTRLGEAFSPLSEVPMQAIARPRNEGTASWRPIRSSFAMFASDANDSDDEKEQQTCQRFTLQEFNVGLERVRTCLHRLLDYAVVFRDLAVIGQDRLTDVDVNAEIETIVAYPDFKDRYDTESVRRGVRDILSLFQYSAVIKMIATVCEQHLSDGCLLDARFMDLKRHGEELQNASHMDQLTTGQRRDLKVSVDKLLSDTPVEKLRLFAAVKLSDEFFMFVRKNKFYSPEGKASFRQQVELITNQLQDQEYDETVLSHLQVAFRCVVPFTDPQITFTDLLKKLNESDIFRFSHWFNPLRTVNSNITTIKAWFSKAEGDTIENVTRDLEAVMDGSCVFVLGSTVTAITGKRLPVSPGLSDNCQFHLKYTVQVKGPEQQPTVSNQPSVGESGDLVPMSASLRQHAPEERWERSVRGQVMNAVDVRQESLMNSLCVDRVHVEDVGTKAKHKMLSGEELDDYLLKLRFVLNEQRDEQQLRMRDLLTKTDILRGMFEVCCQLHRLGHPEFRGKPPKSYAISSISEDQKDELKKRLTMWEGSIAEMQRSYPQLLLFSIQQILALAEALTHRKIIDVVNIISALFSNSQRSFTVLESKIQQHFSLTKPHSQTMPAEREVASPFQLCGDFLRVLFKDAAVSDHLYPQRRLPSPDSKQRGHFVHFSSVFKPDQVLRLILQIYRGLPESFELMRCTSSTSMEELEMFLGRTQVMENRIFLIVNVDELSTGAQELVLRFQLNSSSSQSVHVHYITTGSAVLHEVPWIEVIQYKEQETILSADETVDMCRRGVLEGTGIQRIELVFGRAGDGKSHYIRKQMNLAQSDTCTIAVHEAFTVHGAITKLQQMTMLKENCLYFNVTLSPPSDQNSEEAGRYQLVMSRFYGFLFDLLAMGFVQDPITGQSFRVRGGCGWLVYIEVPSITGQDDGRKALDCFLDVVPILKYVGSMHRIASETPFEIDADAQLVCKYLRALKSPRHINRLCYNNIPVKFSTDREVESSECQQLLLEAMAKHVKDRKINQRLFVKYMKKRCDILDNAPGFNYNTGGGEYVVDKRTGKKRLTDTRELGFTLLDAMLKEVNSFCHPDIQSDWKLHSHQQLVYEFKSGLPSFQFLSLNPEKLDQAQRERLEKIGITIPTLRDLNDRQLLDRYLSSALDLDLKESRTAGNGVVQKRLSVIDEEQYVLTVDYAVKMLAIHERRMCGVPVVIEGETGVGKTALVRMLALLWNQSLARSRRIALERIYELLQTRQCAGLESPSHLEKWYVDAANRLAHCIKTETKPDPEVVNRVCAVKWKDIRNVLLSVADKPSMYMFDIDTNLIAKSREDNTSEVTARLLEAFLVAKSLDTFHKLSFHSALTPEDISQFFSPIFHQALELERLATECGEKQPPTIVVFLDEINTSSFMGLVKELIVDRSLEGKLIPSNVFLVAACNPHRERRVSSLGSDKWVWGSYYVRPLPPTIHYLKWDYGALDETQECSYIQQKIAMKQGNRVVNRRVLQYSSLITKCQSMIRQFAFKQLKQCDFTDIEAKKRAKSCVSQRDIQRVFTLAAYFEESYRRYPPERSHDCITRRAFLVSMGIVYYLRLDDKYRNEFCRQLGSVEGGTTEFLDVFTKEIDFYAGKMHIPVGIAQTRALKENVFATIVCTACHLPLIIVGPPGSSKTLSFNLVLLNLKGSESRESFFRGADHLPALDPYHYQCSRRSTSLEIQNVFNRAIKRQLHYKRAKLPINCVVFMDEAGLPEESHESLKLLHCYLDNPRVSFVAITNHILDAAKSNRAISLFRPAADEEDLKTLSRGCLCSDPSNPPTKMRKIIGVVDRFCSAYAKLMDKRSFFEFFGLRDFIHFIGYIRRHRGSSTELTPGLVLKALERNFNGMEKTDFQMIANMFLSEMNGTQTDDLGERNTVEVLRESLADLSLTQSADNDGIEAEVRYKLIIDASEDDSMARLLFMHGVLDQTSTRTFSCSDFPGDGDIQKVHIISAIKHAALEGRTVILRQTDDINESFYDLFNQHFRRIDDPSFDDGRRYYANIAVGSHSKPCRVDPKFQCIVHMRQSEVTDAPAPFLNRFEKFLVSQDDLLQIALAALPSCITNIVTLARKRVEYFQEAIGKEHFYGNTDHTLQSLFLELLPPCGEREISMYESLEALVRPENNPDDAEDDDEEKHSRVFLDETWQQQAPKILEDLEHVIRNCLGFRFSERTASDRQFQANAIFSAVLQLFEETDGKACRHELIENSKKIQRWLAEGLRSLLRFDQAGRRSNCRDSHISRNASFGVSALVQWIVFHVCSSLLKIVIPESLILKRGNIPSQYLLEYLNQQPHFSLKGVISRVLKGVSVSSPRALVVSKVICFTRTTSVLHSLSSSYPHGTLKHANSHAVQLVEQLLPEGFTNGLVMLKLESIRTLEAFTNILQDYMENTSKSVFLLIANMQSCSQRRINHVRAMIEERELSSYANNVRDARKHFILLLHFPPSLGYTKPCYPTLFLHGWEHIYLDSLSVGLHTDPVDVRQWMLISFAPVENKHGSVASDYVSEQLNLFSTQLMECLIRLLPHAINVAVSRVLFGDNDKCHLNRKMDAKSRADLLLHLLDTLPSLSEVLREKFAIAWDVNTVADQLSIAAHCLLEQDSCLTVSDRLQSRFRTLFYNYLSLSLFQLNKDYNLEILFEQFDSNDEEVAVKTLFVEIFKTLPVPQLNELRLQNHIFDARQPFQQWLQTPSIFPFFSLIAQQIEQLLDEILISLKQELVSSTLDTDLESTLGEKPQSVNYFRPRDIESEAARRLLQMLKAPTDEGARRSLEVTRLACQAISGNGKLWERYLADFSREKLHCYLGHYTSQEHRLLSACLGQLRSPAVDKCVVQLHVTVRLRQKQVFATITTFKLLQSLKTLHPDANLFDVGTVTKPGHFDEQQLYIYIINVMYGSLENILSDSSACEDQFLKWCSVYSNLGSAIPAMAVFFSNDASHESKLQAIHIVYVFMRSVHLERSACAIAMQLAREVCSMRVSEDASTIQGLPLSSVIETGLDYLRQALKKNVKGGTTDALFSSYRDFVEDVLDFYFPSVTFGSELCSSSDFCWLLKMVNSQDPWFYNEELSHECVGSVRPSVLEEESVSAGDRIPVGFVPFKILQQYLTRILHLAVNVDRRTGFSYDIRRMIGGVLCERCSRSEIGPYIPTCYPRVSTNVSPLRQPLATVYFHCCLTSLTEKLGESGFVHLLGLLEQYDSEIPSSETDLAVLQIERQAILQIIISKFSEMFESAGRLKLILHDDVISQVNDLFQDQEWGGGDGGGHIFTFLHHLLRNLSSARSLITLFTDSFDTFCEPFPWMRPLFEALMKKPRVESHLFPFMRSSCSVETSQTALYKQMSSLVGDVAVAVGREKLNEESAAVDKLCDFCSREAQLSEGNSMHLRMMLWLAVYYQLYERKIESRQLADAVCALDCIGLDKRQGQLLRCFAVTQEMKQCSKPCHPEEIDPLWNLFCLSHIDGQDQSDVDLRRALALLAAVAMGLPARSTHLWTHLFEPTAIDGTFVTGFMYPTAVKQDGLLYDCGCELTADGDYGRADYAAHARRGTLNLHSLYLLLWVNFGAFCLSLLTQPGAQDVIKGRVISEGLSVRHYCLAQLKRMWGLMRNSLSCIDEERTLFVTTALYEFLEVTQKPQSPLRGAVFTDAQDLDSYERAFHVEVFQPTLEKFRNKPLVNETIWRGNPLLTSLRTFSATYPSEATYKDFVYSLEHVQSDASHQLSVLCKFVREKQRLRIGGLLLPDLVQFYVWLHQQLSHLITRRRACDLSVGNVVERLTKRYSATYADNIRRLFSRVQDNYNKYLELTGIAVGQCHGLRAWSENKLPKLEKSTKLVQLLSYTEEEEDVCPDALFVVIRSLVTSQNEFVQAVATNDKVEMSALELGWHNCLMGDVVPEELQQYAKGVEGLSDDPGAELMTIIRKHYLYVPIACTIGETGMVVADLPANVSAKDDFQTVTTFDVRRLQKDVVTRFIDGKPFVSDPAQIRVVFRYREEAAQCHPSLKSSDNVDAHIDLPTLRQELPAEFQAELPAARRKELDIVFHDLNYRDSVDTMKGLRVVAGHLCQTVMEMPDKDKEAMSMKCRELSKLTVRDFVQSVYDETQWSQELRTRIGFPRFADRHHEEILRTRLSQLYETLASFNSKLCAGEYEFAHLPLTLKTSLPEASIEAIKEMPAAYAAKGRKSAIVQSLKQFDQTLLHSERSLEKEAKKSLVAYLVENTDYSAADLPVWCLPGDIRVEHYMHVRLATQRVLGEVPAGSNVTVDPAEARQWSDVVTSLLEEFPQLDHRLSPKRISPRTQLPVLELGGEGGLRHPLWFEETAEPTLDDDDDELSVDSNEDYDSTLKQLEIHTRPDDLQLDRAEEGRQGSAKEHEALLTAVGSSDQDTRYLIEEGDSDKAGGPVGGKEAADSTLTLAAVPESLSPQPQTRPLIADELLRTFSSEDKKSLIRRLQSETGKDLDYMSVDDVSSFLEVSGFGKYVAAFRESEIDGYELQRCEKEELKALKVEPLDCIKILKAVQRERNK